MTLSMVKQQHQQRSQNHTALRPTVLQMKVLEDNAHNQHQCELDWHFSQHQHQLQFQKTQKSQQYRKFVNRQHVVTQKEFLQELEDQENEKLEKEQRKKNKKEKNFNGKASITLKKPAIKKSKSTILKEIANAVSESETSSEEETTDDDKATETIDSESVNLIMPTDDQLSPYLKNVWKSISPPLCEEDVINKYYAGIYFDVKKKTHLFVGKATKRFLVDENGLAAALELDCFKKKVGFKDNILEDYQPHQKRDVAIFPVQHIISSDLVCVQETSRRGSIKFEFPEYPVL